MVSRTSLVIVAWMLSVPVPVRAAARAATDFWIEPLDAARQARMRGVSWHEGCPVALSELAIVHVQHWAPDDALHEGELVVAKAFAQRLVDVFRTLRQAHFVIQSVRPIEEFGGSDDASMAANNTSAFNCRTVPGRSTVSRHAYGEAVDVNPLWNPFVRDGEVMPPEGRKWLERKPAPGVITDGDVVVKAFRSIEWKWGGNWKKSKDYQHFSSDGT